MRKAVAAGADGLAAAGGDGTQAIVATAAAEAIRTAMTGPRGPVYLDVPTDVLSGRGHLNPDAGYGPWPAVLDWAQGAKKGVDT